MISSILTFLTWLEKVPFDFHLSYGATGGFNYFVGLFQMPDLGYLILLTSQSLSP